jgi:hypothetical protein
VYNVVHMHNFERRRWTEEEDRFVREYYATLHGTHWLKSHFPDRTLRAVFCHAKALGLTKGLNQRKGPFSYNPGKCIECDAELPIPRISHTKRCDACRALHHRFVKHRRYYAGLRQAILEAYGRKCACCGETEEEFLQLDHIENDGAAERKRLRGSNGHYDPTAVYRLLKRTGFPKDRYRLLCANCNWARRRTGLCPHERQKAESA